MSENKERKIALPPGNVFNDILLRIKLVWRLMGDSRVSPLLKALPVGTILYLVFPDLAPGPIDDAAVIWLGAYLFVELCPPWVVQEHMEALHLVAPGELHQSGNGTQPEAPRVMNEKQSESKPVEEQVIDADFRDAQE
jgi:hypothetical protein